MASEAQMEKMASFGDHIDVPTFEQILEMDDDDDDQEFSKGIVFGFFEQAETTFENMSKALNKKDLADLSSLGHFLKGSSATLGLNHMKISCEKIQHLGLGMDETGTRPQKKEDCLDQIETELAGLRSEYEEVERKLKEFYQ